MRRVQRFIGLVAVIAATASCGNVVRDGRSPVFLTIDSLLGIRGASSPGQPGNPLVSDVITNVTTPAPCTPQTPCPTIFGDPGQVILTSSLKDIVGTPANPASPTSNNDVTITRFHVAYRRSDGRNVEGTDVPYAIDGAVTGTVHVGTTTTMGFELVRSQAKMESPLVQLRVNPGVLTTIADVTFYGQDQVGNAISVTGSIQIDFGNFGDF